MCLRIRRSATSAASIANAPKPAEQTKRREVGEDERRGPAGKHEGGEDKWGAISTVARSTAIAGSSTLRSFKGLSSGLSTSLSAAILALRTTTRFPI
jgi:hypothetical protein